MNGNIIIKFLLLLLAIKGAQSSGCLAGEYDSCYCESCGDNYYSAAGSDDYSDCIQCNAGNVVKQSQDGCEPCAAGRYESIGVCERCGDNQISGSGSTSCSSCPAGKTHNNIHTACSPCASGKYRTTSMTTCEDCGVGSVLSSDQSSCDACAAGTKRGFSDTACVACTGPLEYSTEGSSSCSNCPNGKVANNDHNGCELCPAGEYRTGASTSCQKCSPGEEPNADQSSCIDCEIGKYKDTADLVCSLCPGDQFNDVAGSTSCGSCSFAWQVPQPDKTSCGCPAGEKANDAVTGCEKCPVGEYSGVGELDCLPCGENSYSDELGAEQCTPCIDGEISIVTKDGCDPCPAGQYRSSSETVCTPCDENHISVSPASASCTECPDGEVANSEKTMCEKCPAGQYRSSSETVCTPCDEKHVSSSPGSASCTECPDGEVANSEKTICRKQCEQFPDYIANGYKIPTDVNEDENGNLIATYKCYPTFVMNPNKDLMTSAQGDGDDVTDAYMKLYNVAKCLEAVHHFPECVDPESAKHCGLPTKIENGKAEEFMLNQGDGYEDAEMPTMAKYVCDADYKMHHTMKDNKGWCREDGSMELPSCEREDDYTKMEFKLQNGNMRKSQRPDGTVFAGIVLAREVDKDDVPTDTDWVYTCNDGTNDYAAGAVCRSLGFESGHRIPALKKMMADKHEFGWTKVSCKYDDTLISSDNCEAWSYQDAVEKFGHKKATCYSEYDIAAVECFDAKFKMDMQMIVYRKKMACLVQFYKEDNLVDLEKLGSVKTKFLLDDVEVETGEVRYKPRKGFFTRVNMVEKDYICASCEVYVDDKLLDSAKWCKIE